MIYLVDLRSFSQAVPDLITVPNLDQIYLITDKDVETFAKSDAAILVSKVAGVFYENGVSLSQGTSQIWQSTRPVELSVVEDALSLVKKSSFPHRYGRHVMTDGRKIHISTVGANATSLQEMAYFMWDEREQERENWIAYLEDQHPDYHFTVKGTASLIGYGLHDVGRDLLDIIRLLHPREAISYIANANVKSAIQESLTAQFLEYNCFVTLVEDLKYAGLSASSLALQAALEEVEEVDKLRKEGLLYC